MKENKENQIPGQETDNENNHQMLSQTKNMQVDLV